MKNNAFRGFLIRNPLLKDIIWIAFISVVYFIVGRLSMKLVLEPEDIATVWPASGIFLSALLLTKKNLRPYLALALFITDFIVESYSGSSFAMSIVYAFALTFDASLSAWILIRYLGEPIDFSKLKHLLSFIIISVIFTNALSATVAAAAPKIIYNLPYWHSWKWWWLSDGIGNLLITPFILSWASLKWNEARERNIKHFIEAMLLFLSMVIVNFYVLQNLSGNIHLASILNYLAFPFLVWAALRFGVRGVTVASIFLTANVLYFTLSGQTIINDTRVIFDSIIMVQIYIAIISVSSLIMASVIEERKQTQKVLHESAEKFRVVFEYSPVGKSITGLDGSLQTNKAFSDMLGYSEEEFQSIKWKEITHPDDIAESNEIIDSLIKGEYLTRSYEKRYLHKNGSIIFADVRTTLKRNEQDNPIFLITVVTDITERKKAEAEILRLNQVLEQRVIERTEQLETANKELESFSYSVSHDLRAPLRAIAGFTNKLSENYIHLLDEEGKRLTGIIIKNTNKMGQLIDDLLTFSRLGRKNMTVKRVDMQELFKETWEEIKTLYGRHIIKFKIHELPKAYGDPVLLKQVVLNLLTNAAKFTKYKDEAIIEVGIKMENGNNIYFVKDNGAGFNQQYSDKMFQVFQRLHSEKEFEGTGIGLAIVKRIINMHGGKVWAEGKENEGAVIYFDINQKEMEK